MPNVPDLLWIILLGATAVLCTYAVLTHTYNDTLLQRAGLSLMTFGAIAEIKSVVSFTHYTTGINTLFAGLVLFGYASYVKRRTSKRSTS